jgi:hypothetical protein
MNIPAPHLQPAIDAWVNHGFPAPTEMGSFLRAVLQHDLMGAARHADVHNRTRLADWAFYLHNELPSPCHGSAEVLEAWHAHGGLFGRKESA